jgi:hypothetical protein
VYLLREKLRTSRGVDAAQVQAERHTVDFSLGGHLFDEGWVLDIGGMRADPHDSKRVVGAVC